MKKKLIIGFISVFIALLAFQIYRVDLRKTSWEGPTQDTLVYVSIDQFGSINTYTFMPGKKLILSREGQCVEVATFETVLGNQFFDFLWKTPLPDRHWAKDFSYVQRGMKPMRITITPISQEGDNCLGLPRIGKIYDKYMEINGKKMNIEGNTYTKLKNNVVDKLNLQDAASLLEE